MKLNNQSSFIMLMMCCISFNVTSQSIVSVTPAIIARGQTLDISVTAADTDFLQGTNLVRITNGSDTYYANSEHGIDETTLIANFTIGSSSPLDFYSLFIMTYDGETMSKSNAIEIIEQQSPPSIDNILPSIATQGDETQITISGVNTSFMANSQEVKLTMGNNVNIASSVIASDNNTLIATFKFSYVLPPGMYSITVTDSNIGAIYKPDAFELIAGLYPPQIIDITPRAVNQGNTLDIEITAENIDFNQGTNLVKLVKNQTTISPNYFSVVGTSILKANFSFNVNHPDGIYDLVVEPSNNITLTEALAITVNTDLNDPKLISTTPESGKQGQDITVTIRGSETRFTRNNITNRVYLRQNAILIYATVVLPIDDETIVVVFRPEYSHPIGNYTLFVENNYDGTQSLPDAFTIIEGDDVPAIVSVSPPVIEQGQTLDIELTGENIDFSQGTNLVKLTQDFTTIVMNSSHAISPTVVSANFTFRYDHPVGNYILSIWNSNFDITLIDQQTLIKPQAFFLKSASISTEESIKTYTSVQVHPNPVRDILYISKTISRIQLYNMRGERIFEEWDVSKVNTSNFPDGMYIAIMWDADEITTHKILIAK